jgi:hypothetical protein
VADVPSKLAAALQNVLTGIHTVLYRTSNGMFFDNIRMAHVANTDIQLLMCRPFPQVTIPVELAVHVGLNARKYLERPSAGMARV